MERRGLVVGGLATLSAALAAGALSTPPASAGGGGVNVGFSTGGLGGVGGVLWLVVLLVLVAGGLVLVVTRLRGAGGTASVRRRFVALVLAVGAFVAGVLFVALRAFGDGDGPGRQDGVGGPLLQAAETGSRTVAPGPGAVLAVLVVLAVVVLGVVAYRRFASEAADDAGTTTTDGDAATGSDGVATDALGSAAGRAAAHIDGREAPPENDVLRAWRELAAVLPVSRPATSTPREFAAAATDAGVDADDVEELTRLFEAVRYGARSADGERARRAVAALERIRTAHAPTSDASTDERRDNAVEEVDSS